DGFHKFARNFLERGVAEYGHRAVVHFQRVIERKLVGSHPEIIAALVRISFASAIISSITCAVSTARLWYRRTEISSISENWRAFTRFVRVRSFSSSFS